MLKQQTRMFSPRQQLRGSVSVEEMAAPQTEFSAAEIAENKNEWGIKYNDECLKFEKEWEFIANAVEKE